MRLNKNFQFIFVVFLLSFFAKNVFAVNLYFLPEKKNVLRGEVFLQKILIDTEGENINTVEGEIIYPIEYLKVENISIGNSILKIWPKEPEAKEGKVHFIGGVPGGFIGKDGLLVIVAFKSINKENQDFAVEISENSKVLLNDGKGTRAKIKLGFAKIKAFKDFSSKNEWEEFLRKDKNPPEPFKIKLSRSPYIFDNQYFISFVAFDKESGIDYYKVAEVKTDRKLKKDELIRLANWKVAKSPYLLEDQELKSYILVKAVDKAGNERVEILKPKKGNNLATWTFVFILIVGGGIIIKKIKNKNKIGCSK